MTRATWLRAAAVTVITATVTLAAACSEQDTVDTVPPPWPTRTTTPDGPTEAAVAADPDDLGPAGHPDRDRNPVAGHLNRREPAVATRGRAPRARVVARSPRR